MQSIFDKENYEELVSRLQKLNANSTPLWGKMNVAQMLHHLNLAMETPLGTFQPKGKPVFFMRPFRSVLYNDKPFGKGAPTPKDYKITGSFDFTAERDRALADLKQISERGINSDYKPHVFFGTLTNEQWGRHFYKHTDHHLRQFGV